MDHMVDLDQALNELERQESEELLKKNKKTEQVSIDTNELSSTSLSEVKLSIEQNNCLISLSEIIENDTVSNKQQAILESELESELNDIMQSLIMDEKSLSKKELIIIEHEKITIEHKTVLLDERPEEFPVIDEFEKNVDVTPIEYVNSIGEDYSTRKSEPVHSDPIKKEEKIQETMDEIFSSPNEDSECYFDTIEANSTALDPESAEKTSNNLETVKPEEIVHSLESLDDLNKTDLLCLSASNSETLTQIEETNPITPTFDTMNETPISESDTNESLDHSTNTIEPAAINQDLSNDLVAITETAYMEATHHETDNSEATNSQTSAECQQPEQQTPDENRIPIEVTDYQTEWSDLTESEKTLGLIAPAWMPDPETDVCLKCSTKFSFRTRRHHCRACGLIFCSKCCYLKISLPYIVNKSNSTNINNNMNENTENEKPTLATKSEMSRCCNGCYEVITKVNNLRINMLKVPTGNTPIVSVLKKKSASVNQISKTFQNEIDPEKANTENSSSAEANTSKLVRSKSVRFSDDLLPGTEANSLVSGACATSLPNDDLSVESAKMLTKKKSSYLLSKKYKISSKHTFRQSRFIEEELIARIKITLIKNNLLPPILIKDEIVDSGTVCLDEEHLIKEKLLSCESDYLTFMLLRNLKVFTKIINFDCCTKQKCWLFVTNGLCLNGQEELVFFLKCKVNEQTNQVEEKYIPREILYHVIDLFEKSAKGYRLTQMNHVLYDFESAKKIDSSNESNNSNFLLDNKENVGFLYYQPTEFHKKCCLKSLKEYLPEENFLIGYLLQKWEIPWAKLFPLRLFLSIGENFKTYPTSLISDRYRKPIFGDIGHTIMSLLCDVRNFQYTIAQIDGLKIQMEGSSTLIIIPESQYDLIVKSLLTSNEYVFSLACLQMNDSCSSHLVTVENENLGTYTNKTISFSHNDSDQVNKVTGAAFVVFNGALKANLTNNAKISVVEDGLMIQIETDTMNRLKQALQSMKAFRLDTLKPQVNNLNHQYHTTQTDNNTIIIEWTKESPINIGINSVIDNRPLSGVKSLRLTNPYDYVNDTKGIRWTEIFLIEIEDESNDSNFNLNRFADMCSTAFCTAVTPLLEQLVSLQKLHLESKRKLPESSYTAYASHEQEKDLSQYSRLINPFKIGLRIQIDKDQVGYLIGMNGKQINEDSFLASLDNELIQLLNHASSFNINIVLEFVFYVQERFNCSNKYVVQ